MTKETPLQDKLSDKRQVFVQAYCMNGHNATQAYKSAYPNCKTGHNRLGHRLMTNDDILKAIDERMVIINEKTEMDEIDILKALVFIALHGTETGRLRALELLGKNRRMWIDRLQTDQPLMPQEFTEEEFSRYKAIAEELVKPDIKLVKGG